MLYIKHLREWKAMSIFLRHFTNADRNLFVTEFGHSMYTESKRVGPWSRGIYILHFVSRGYCEFSGFKAEAGQAFLIAKEHLHSFTTSEDYEHYWIGILGDSLEKIFDGFKDMSEAELKELYNSLGMAMTFKDFLHIQNYFKNEEKRDPTETEIYIVKKGDTLWDIAKKYSSTVDDIIEINELAEDADLKDMRLLIPRHKKIL